MAANPILGAALHHWPVTVALFLYFYEAWICLGDRNEPGALTFVAYAVANAGVVWGFFRLISLSHGAHT